MIRRNAARLLVLGAVVTACASCGDVVRDGSSPVYLVIDTLTASRGVVGVDRLAFAEAAFTADLAGRYAMRGQVLVHAMRATL